MNVCAQGGERCGWAGGNTGRAVGRSHAQGGVPVPAAHGRAADGSGSQLAAAGGHRRRLLGSAHAGRAAYQKSSRLEQIILAHS